jgi:hypothetical protein
MALLPKTSFAEKVKSSPLVADTRRVVADKGHTGSTSLRAKTTGALPSEKLTRTTG